MSKPEILSDSPDFSLVLGGPLFQFFRRTHLCGARLELAWRRVVIIAGIAWLPLLVLSFIEGRALGGEIKIPFLYDVEASVRFLIALPILIAAELVVHSRVQPAVKRFVDRRLIIPEEMPKFHAAINSGLRLRNSVWVELIIVILVYTLGLWIWRSQIAAGTESWYATSAGTQWHLTLAGYWYGFVSIPIFQFILVRWYMRLFIWFQFLWRVSRLNLRLNATHPDRACGLGFLGHLSYAFSPILFAQGALLSGMIANRVLYEGQSLADFKVEAGGLVVFFLLFILGPLLVFTPHLTRAKRRGLGDYGGLASRYVQEFQGKWIHGGAPSQEDLLGSGDIQSLADLGNSFTVVQETRPVPFGLKDAIRLAVATAAPLIPLALTVLSLEDLVVRLVQIIF